MVYYERNAKICYMVSFGTRFNGMELELKVEFFFLLLYFMYEPESTKFHIDNGIPSYVGFAPNRERLLCCSSTGYCYLFSIPELKLLMKKPVNDKGINEAAFSSDGSFFVTAGDDNIACIVETENLRILRKLSGHHAPAYCCDVSNDNTRILTGSKDISFRVWDPRSSHSIQEVGGHTEPVISISYNYDNSLILTGSYDGIVRLWESVSYICLRTYVADGSSITKALFTPNSCYVAMFWCQSEGKLVEIKSGEVYRQFKGHENKTFRIDATFIQTQPEGELVATSEDGRIISWNPQNSEVLWTMKVSDQPLGSLAILEDGSKLCYSTFDDEYIVIMNRRQ